MAAFLFDLDGTLVKHKTNEPLDGTIKLLKIVARHRHQIIFTTKRGPRFSKDSVYGEQSTKDLVALLTERAGLPACQLIMGVESPRIIVNDGGCASMGREENSAWSDEDIETLLSLNCNP